MNWPSWSVPARGPFAQLPLDRSSPIVYTYVYGGGVLKCKYMTFVVIMHLYIPYTVLNFKIDGSIMAALKAM